MALPLVGAVRNEKDSREPKSTKLALTRQVMNFTFPALFFAGALTFLSPCVLPLVPIYLAMLAGTSAVALREGSRGKGLFASTIAFSLGLAAVFVMLGLAASAMGRTLSGHRALVFQLAGLAIFLAGLKLMGLLRVPWLDREARPWLASVRRSSGLVWPFLFGAAFALGWSPCVGPVLGSVLAFAGTAGSPTKAALYLGTYALGLTLPLVAVSLVAPAALRLLDRAKRHLRVFELASGTLLTAMGLLLITGHESLVMTPHAALAAPAAATSSTTPAPVPATCNAGVSPAAQTPEASAAAATQGIPTMLEFVAAGCPICQRMHPVVAAAERDCSRHGIRVVQIDVSSAAGREVAAQHGVLGVPTFLFLDGAGKEVARLVGEQPLPVLIQSLEVLAGEKCDGFRPITTSPAAGS
jgi:cytochrome c-type biogenesis protein